MADPRLTEQANNLIHDIHIYRSEAGHFMCTVRLLHKTDHSEDAFLEVQGFAHRLKFTTKLPDGLEGARKYLGTISSEFNSPEPLLAYHVVSTQPCTTQEDASKFAAETLFSLAETTGISPSELLTRVNPGDLEKQSGYLSKLTIAPYLETLGKQRMH